MDKAITTALLIVISMVMAISLFNVAYPAITQGGNAIANMANRSSDRLRSEIRVIHATSELDSTGHWTDTNGNGLFDVFIWVKNIGSLTVDAIADVDLFFGPEGNFARIRNQVDGSGFPYWTSQIENATSWTPTATLRITVHYPAPVASGRYYVNVTLPNGVADTTLLSL
ncbi:MAG: hypothetical protein KF716_21315 [Anaerolineae bacterium]|nr:hypothetical protein [Anaerolineae bacterium]